jgi:CrcB protein
VNRSTGGRHDQQSLGSPSESVAPNHLDPTYLAPDVDSDIDPDVGRDDQAATAGSSPGLLAAISAGGILGAEARYALSVALPYSDRQFPWSTLVINVTGCLLIGVLMTALLSMPSPHRLVRPFLGVGVLGGYTTYSGFAVETQGLLLHHRPLVALGYAASTVLACAGAVWVASTLTARVLAPRSERVGAVRPQ